MAPTTRRSRRIGSVRFLRGHRPRLNNPGHEVDPATGCWRWLGYVNPRTGYAGSMQHGDRTEPAHRAYYLKHVGAIPPGHHLDHLCRNRWCVNPAHLEPVLPKVNVRRGAGVKLSAADAASMRYLVAQGVTHGTIARYFGVSRSLVSLVSEGKRWVA